MYDNFVLVVIPENVISGV